MKKQVVVVVIIGMVTFFCAERGIADTKSDFVEIYEHIAHLTHQLFEEVSHASMSESSIADETLMRMVEALITNAKTLETLAGQLGQIESANEVRQMTDYLNRFKHLVQTEGDHHALIMMLSRYYLHFHNCLMLNPICLKDILHAHLEELKEAVDKNDFEVIVHVAEHQYLHADQMYYAALIFEKKIWQKFALQIKMTADDIYAAAREGDLESVRTGIGQIEQPIQILRQLVK